jgi:hypothetical protein
MNKRNANIWIKEGTEVHGPDGWVALLGDCAARARLDESGYEWHYNVGNADFWVSASDCLVL